MNLRAGIKIEDVDISKLSVAEIKKLILELNEKVTRMSLLLDEAQVKTNSGSFDYDVETGVIDWSDHNFEVFGLDKKNGEPSLSEFINHIVQSDQQYVKNALEKVIMTGNPFDVTYRWRCPDGKTRFINSIGGLKSDETTGRKILVGINQDVTDKKNIEEEVRKNARKHQAIISTTHDGFFVIDKNGRIVETNPAFRSMIGFTGNELLEMNVADLDASESAFDVQTHIQKITNQGWDQFESRHRRKDGVVISINISSTFLQVEGGIIINFARDITTARIEKDLLEARIRIEEFSYSHSLDELLQKCIDETELLTGSNIGFYHFVEEDQENLRLQMWSSNTLENMCSAEGKGFHYSISKAGVWVDCVKTKKPVIHNDYTNLKHKKGLPDGHAKVVRELVVPVIRGNKIKAILGVGNKRTNYHSADIDVVSKLADLAWDIVERKRAEEALSSSEYKYRTLFKSLHQGVFYQNADGKLIDANPAALEILGLTNEQFEQRDSFHPEWFTVDERGVKLEPEKQPSMIALKTGKPVDDFPLGVFNPVKKEIVWLIVNAIPQFFKDEKTPSRVFVSMQDITERKRSEEKFRQIFDESPIGIGISDLNGKIIQANRAIEKISGYDLSVDKNLKVTDLYAKKNERELLLRKLQEDGFVHDYEVLFKKKNGENFYALLNVDKIKVGSSNYLMANLRDITPQKHAENALIESEEKFRQLVERSDEIFYRQDIDTAKFEYISSKAKDILGYSSEELTEMDHSEQKAHIHPDDLSTLNNFREQIIAADEMGEKNVERAFRLKHKNGEYRWMYGNYSLVRDAENKPKLIVGSLRDITNQKNFEEKLQKSNESYQLAIDGGELGTFDVDLKSAQVIVNERYLSMIGYELNEKEEFRTHNWRDKIHPDDQPQVQNLITKIESGEINAMEVEYRIQHKNGNWIWISDRCKGYNYDNNGKPRRAAGTHKDITARKNAEEALRVSEAKLSQAMIAAHLGHWEHDLITDILTFNDEFYALLKTDINKVGTYQLSPKEYVERFVHPDDRSIIPEAIKKALDSEETNESFRFEHRVLFGDGTTGYIVVQFKVIKNEKGESVKTIGVNQDITERKLNEYLLRASEEKYRYLFEANKDAVALFPFDETGAIHNFSQVNKATTDILGYTKTELLNLSVADIEIGLTPEKVKNRIDQLFSSGVTSFEAEVMHKNGSRIPMEMKTSIALIEGKKYLLTIARDIEDRKNAEKALLESETRYKSIVQELLVGITIHVDGEIVFVNEAMKRIMGGTKNEEFIGRSIFEFVHCDDRQMVIDAITSSLNVADLSSGESSLVIEERLIKLDGTIITAEASAISLEYYGRQALMVMINDITERKLAEKALEESEKNLTSIINATPDIICFKDGEGRWLKANEGILNLYELTNVDYAGKKELELAEFTAPIYKEGFRICTETDDTAWKYGVQSRTEEVIPRANGEERVYDVIKVPSFNEDGSRKALVVFGRDVTERKHLENTLRQSEEKFRNFFDADLAGDYKSCVDGTLLDCNPSFLKILEFDSKEQAISTNMKDIYPKVTNRAALLAKLKREKSLELVETKLITRKGREIIVIESMIAEFDVKGKFVGATGFMIDVTQLKISERALKESEKNYRELFNRMQSGFAYHEVVCNRTGKVVDYRFLAVNPMYEKLTGFKAENLLGRTVLEAIPATEQYWIETYGKVALGGKPLRFEQYSVEVGKYFKVLVYSPEKFKFATIFEDITETKKTEEKIRQLSMAVEQSSATVVITNVDGTIEYVNPIFTKLTGYSSEEVIGKNPRILKSGYSTEQDYKSLWRSIKSGKDWSGIFNNRKKNGELYWEASVISPMRDSKGKITHFIAIKEDITEKIKKDRELEAYKLDLERMVEQRTQELNLSNVKLQEEVVRQKNTEALLKVSLTKEKELSELKTRFISTTSHEFRTPLTSILSSTELLQKYGKKWSEEKFAEHVDRTKRAVEYLVKLLEDVLTISRTESGKIGFDPAKINLKNFCKDIIKETESQAKENHKLIFMYKPKLQEFSLDPKLLKFILLNLIVNAYKYSPAGGEVSFIVTSNKQNVNFTVSDHGIGIPDEEKPYIFDNFHRNKNSVDIPGTGLGLAIVKRSVEIHHGTIGFISKLNIGTTFKVSLPIHFQKDESAVTQINSSID